MDSEKKYKEALERAKKFKNGEIELEVEIGENVMEYIFPELKEKESKDERIRKVIYGWICSQPSYVFEYGFSKKEILDWLEKQDQSFDVDDTDVDFTVYYPLKNGKGHYECIPYSFYGTLSSFGEDKDMIDFLHLCFYTEEECNEWIKQNESTDKVEPKFHVGDWVVTSYGKVNQVISVDKDGDGFTLDDDTYFSGSWKDGYHLWTIADAKDGDVLATKDGRPFIFKDFSDINHPNNPTAYCGINGLNCFIVTLGNFWWTDEEVYPATQEQCCFLYQKMKESNYTFDLKNKKLIKK